MLRNLFANRIKRFYSVENLVQKPVGEQDKTHELSLCVLLYKRPNRVNCTKFKMEYWKKKLTHADDIFVRFLGVVKGSGS